ncbi:hypothetical protein OH687_23815 [Burkholderia anthina]|nr:hypothetical protein OH687_23815 [Burkholderia anthina]
MMAAAAVSVRDGGSTGRASPSFAALQYRRFFPDRDARCARSTGIHLSSLFVAFCRHRIRAAQTHTVDR